MIYLSSMKTHLLVGSPNGEMKATHVCPRVNLKIRGIDFQADLVVLTSSRIMILGMDWLGGCDGIILCAKKSVLLTSPQGDKVEFLATTLAKGVGTLNQMKGMLLEDIKVVGEYPRHLPGGFTRYAT